MRGGVMSYSKVKTLFGHKQYPDYTKESSLFLLNRNVGVELEYENVSHWPDNIKDSGEFWEITEDGSLRKIKDDSVSLELRFKYPLSGIALEKALVSLKKYLAAEKDIVCSLRTGLHVHLDVRDLSVTQIKNILITYLIVEKILYRYCGDDRENNVFCLPIYKTPEVLQKFSLAAFQDPITFKTAVSHSWKYSGLNLLSIWKKGSIEFRQHSATTNIEEIIYWINLIYSITKYGLSLNYKVDKLIEYAATNDSILDDIFGNYIKGLDLSNLRADLDVGIESVLCLQNNFMSSVYSNYISNNKEKKIKKKFNPGEWREIPSSTEDHVEYMNAIQGETTRRILENNTFTINSGFTYANVASTAGETNPWRGITASGITPEFPDDPEENEEP